MSEHIKGYKVFNSDWTCRGKQYKCPGTFEEDVTPSCCNCGKAKIYGNRKEAIRDLMKLYEGLLCRHYLISPEVTIADLSLLPDGIAYIYIEEESKW